MRKVCNINAEQNVLRHIPTALPVFCLCRSQDTDDVENVMEANILIPQEWVFLIGLR